MYCFDALDMSYACFHRQVARLTWWTLHEKPSETDVMEEARDEEIEMQDLPDEEGEGEGEEAEERKKTGGQEEEEEEADAELNEQDMTEKTPAVGTRPKSHSFSE